MKPKITPIMDDIKKALKVVEDEHNISLEFGNVTYTDDSFHTKMEVTDLGNHTKEEMKALAYDELVVRRGFKDLVGTLGESVTLDNQEFTIVDFKPRATKNFIILENKRGTQYVTNGNTISSHLLLKDIKTV